MRSAFLVGITILAVLLAACGRATHDGSLAATSARSLSRHVGASGMVVAHSAADVRFCGGPFPLVAGPPKCAGIGVVGVNLSTLSYRKASHGVIWGSAYLAGTFSNGILHVREQGPARADGAAPRLADVPCSAPPGGWATSALNGLSSDAVTTYRKQFPLDVTSVAIFHPGPMKWIVTIASTNPRRTIARLSSAYRGRLCVVRSRYELSSVRAASRAVRALLTPASYGKRPYWVTGVGRTTGSDGQPVVQIDVIAVTTALRRTLASQPAGLVTIVPWLKAMSG